MLPILVAIAEIVLASPALAGEGVLEINQACALQTGCFAGDTAGLPVTIATPGAYRLTSNLTGSAATNGITISANDVALDLNGFRIQGNSPGGGTGAGIAGLGNRIVVSNGAVVDFHACIVLPGTDNTIDRVNASTPGASIVIQLGQGCTLSASRISGGVTGLVSGGAECRIVGNRFGDAGPGSVLDVGERSIVENNVVNTINGLGINAPRSRIAGNVISGSTSTAINAHGGSMVVDNLVQSAGAYGILANDSIVTNNRVSNTTIGIRCPGCTVEGNFVMDSSGLGLEAPDGPFPTGYRANRFVNNNGGDPNPQVEGGLDLGGNICGADTTCP